MLDGSTTVTTLSSVVPAAMYYRITKQAATPFNIFIYYQSHENEAGRHALQHIYSLQYIIQTIKVVEITAVQTTIPLRSRSDTT
jgi:hypothetical protein